MTELHIPADVEYRTMNDNAEIVLARRYYRKDIDGNPIEDATKLFWRVAFAIASEESKYENTTVTPDTLAKDFYSMMTNMEFLPNSPTLMNAGTPLGQLAACFVLPVGDSIEEIFDAVKYAAMIHKSGGGTGFSFSRLRPKDSRVGSTGGVASGPVSFIRIFNTATEQIKQGGTRRGANMGILRVDHPDIIEFIRAKEREGEFNNFNFSVALTENFMKAVENNEDYDLVNPHDSEVAGSLNAREVFEILVQKAWEKGDPGIVFLDRINRDNPTPALGQIESTNPCGEQPLLPYEACNLGSINLGVMVKQDDEQPISIDWDKLNRVVHLAVRFLDNVIDASRFPLERITEMVTMNRKIGLGVMGWADLLFQLNIPYNSQEALNLAEKIMEFIQAEGRTASKQLAKERGAFPAYKESIFGERDLGPYRNATVTTIAPTGTLSIIAGCSSGIEPLFALSFARHVMDGEKLVETNPYFKTALEERGCYSRKLMDAITEKGTIVDIDYLPEDLRKVFVTAMDIEAEYHLKMQAAFQKYTDNAVSKTVNVPKEATVDDIRSIYWLAYEQGCKGVTVYRDGSLQSQVLCTESPEREEAPEPVRLKVERPEIVYGFTQKVETGLGVLYVTINEIDGKPFELFTTIGKSGRSITAKAEAIGRLVSLALRAGIEPIDIVRQLKGIGGEHPVFKKKGLLLSIPDAIAWILENRYLKSSVSVHSTNGLTKQLCPDCGGELIFEEGCNKCYSCGYTKCG
ncbi:vitamin B12-dependent ribonucleotide reductase [Halodesulfovibrio marinisediminis]|uniref:Vitamin B12-dependent ribonucleotide reductase n=1 Tax=Halodesulfovibrio marinisediminis DSM 17456 TaxID=1121457 RepID=A0A1N6JBZ2_9BACT|nr:vitamin B12-dependent ribonucleotide reductase [Halodesulfovibrio marinisediminis]SIO41649.1 ribonucleoside-diphosphate reductase class II [Halodesulfovibrio marinisediminis DSM 17456]